MKIGIYNEPSRGGIGGSEICVAVLAEALAGRNEVEIIHHKEQLTRARLSEISGTNLETVRMRLVSAEPYDFGTGFSPVARYNQARSWRASLTEPYDMFINFTHGFPPFCHAPRGALAVLFPFDQRPGVETQKQSNDRSRFWNPLKRSYHSWEWQKRLGTYQIKTAISKFARDWSKRRWDIDCEVIYPPADTHLEPRAKSNLILSVGRFTVSGHSKKQLEMITAFNGLHRSTHDWKYFSIGGLSDDADDQAYFESVSRRCESCCAGVLANVERIRLKHMYEQAKIFWHAAGYGHGRNRPELSEHFGVSTVEAMSAGCVPIVINRGAQPEIVQHGVNGFVWDTLEELREYTELLMRDDGLRSRVSKAARMRAASFSRARFVSRFGEALDIASIIP